MVEIADVLFTDVITINTGYPAKYAESLMRYFGSDCLVVMSDKEAVGLVTYNDIKSQVYTSKLDPHLVLVDEIMSDPLIWVSPKTPINEVIDIMQTRKINRLPVIGNLTYGPVLLGLFTFVKAERLSEKKEAISQ
jgi:CBS domain-containing protein